MPIFTRDGLSILFIHAPKSGGSAIEGFFKQNGFEIDFLQTRPSTLSGLRRCSPQHYHAAMLSCILKLEAFDYVFMTVRNPVARIISEYGMRHQNRDERSTRHFSHWLDRTLNAYSVNPFLYDNHIRPQTEFLLPGCGIYKQEDGFDAAWVEQLAARLQTSLRTPRGMAQGGLSNSHAGQPFPVRQADLDRIADFYAADFEHFGYRLEVGQSATAP